MFVTHFLKNNFDSKTFLKNKKFINKKLSSDILIKFTPQKTLHNFLSSQPNSVSRKLTSKKVARK